MASSDGNTNQEVPIGHDPQKHHNLKVETEIYGKRNNISPALEPPEMDQTRKNSEPLFSQPFESFDSRQSLQSFDSGAAIGIDLGSSYACVAVFNSGKVDVIQNERGNRKTPSCVTFISEDRVFIGESALEKGFKRAQNTIFGAKNFLGKSKIPPGTKFCPFTVEQENSVLYFNMSFENGENLRKIPEEICTFILRAMKSKAEEFLKKSVNKAVVSVPSHFNSQRRAAVLESCRAAGMEPIDLISDPTASAIAYTVDKEINTSRSARKILVFDLGGSNLSVSLITVENGKYKVLGTGGHDTCGGDHFNERLFWQFANQFKNEFRHDISKYKKAVAKLRFGCEKIKRQLSITEEASLDIDALYQGKDFTLAMSRKDFEEMNDDLFRNAQKCVRDVLAISKHAPEDVNDVLLVGGSTRIPRIQNYLGNIFKPQQMKTGINADEAVAYGAAIRAACLTNPLIRLKLRLQEVTSSEYSIDIGSETSEVLFHRLTRIPAEERRAYKMKDNHKALQLEIRQPTLIGQTERYLQMLISPSEPAGEYKFHFKISGNGLFSYEKVPDQDPRSQLGTTEIESPLNVETGQGSNNDRLDQDSRYTELRGLSGTSDQQVSSEISDHNAGFHSSEGRIQVHVTSTETKPEAKNADTKPIQAEMVSNPGTKDYAENLRKNVKSTKQVVDPTVNPKVHGCEQEGKPTRNENYICYVTQNELLEFCESINVKLLLGVELTGDLVDFKALALGIQSAISKKPCPSDKLSTYLKKLDYNAQLSLPQTYRKSYESFKSKWSLFKALNERKQFVYNEILTQCKKQKVLLHNANSKSELARLSYFSGTRKHFKKCPLEKLTWGYLEISFEHLMYTLTGRKDTPF